MALARAGRAQVLSSGDPAGPAPVHPLALAPLGRPRVGRQREERGRRQRELARAAAGGGGARGGPRGRAGRVWRGPPRAAQAHAAHAAVALRARGRCQEVAPPLAGCAALRRAVRLRAQAPAGRASIRRGSVCPGAHGRDGAACLRAQAAAERACARPTQSDVPARCCLVGRCTSRDSTLFH